MPVTNYYTVGGSILAEATGGVRTDYLTDALGSVTATVDSSGNLLNTYRYKPYGEQLAKTGAAADTKFTWVGTLGYRQTGRKHSDTYVRARHYSSTAGRWTTKDPISYEDGFSLYQYALSCPTVFWDNTGLKTSWKDLKPEVTCTFVANCLKQPRQRCGCVSKYPADDNIDLALCLFWQETNFLHASGDNSGQFGGIGNVTPIAFEELKRQKCNALNKYENYADFARRASDCEKAQASLDYMACTSFRTYGPGLGRPGDYRGPTGKLITKCRDCIRDFDNFCRHHYGPFPLPPHEFAVQRCKYTVSACFPIVHS